MANPKYPTIIPFVKPVCRFCSNSWHCDDNTVPPNTKTGRFPELGPEISGYRQCPSCSRWFSNDGENLATDNGGNPVKNPFDFSLAKTEDKEYMEWQ